MRKMLSLLMIGLISTGLLLGCAPSTPENNATQATTDGKSAGGGSEEITVWAWDPQFNIDIMNNAAERYKKINPDVKINVVEMSKADLEQKLHTNLASKMTEGLPDIVLIEDYNAQKYLQSYPGSFADLTNEFDYNEFSPYKVGLMTLDSKVYGVPFDSGATAFYYRSDLLEEAGFKPADLEDITWDRYIEIGKAVKEKTGKALLSFDKSDGGLIRVMMQSAGTWYFDADGNINLANNAALKEAMETYKKIIDANIIKPTSGWNEWVGAFNTGDVPSVTSGAWIIGSVKAAQDQSKLWSMAPTPRLNVAESVNASNLGGSSWYVLESGKSKALALDFMKEIYAKDIDFYQDILVKNGAIACFTPAHVGAAYTAEDEFFNGQTIYSGLSEYMLKIPAINYGLYTYEADAAVMGQLEDVLSGKKTVDEALVAAEVQLKNQIQ